MGTTRTMSITSAASRTTGSLFGTVAIAANTIGSVFSAATKSVEYLDTYVTSALSHQQMRIDADNATFELRLQASTARELADVLKEAQDYASENPVHYERADKLVEAAIAEGKARRLKAAQLNA